MSWWAAWRFQIPTAWWTASAHGPRSVFTSLITLRSALMSLAREVGTGRSVSTVISTTTTITSAMTRCAGAARAGAESSPGRPGRRAR